MMRSRFRRTMVTLGLVASGGMILAGPGSSCTSFAGQLGMMSTDFCFIFDCQNGILGGTIDPCGTSYGMVGEDNDPLLIDCPNTDP